MTRTIRRRVAGVALTLALPAGAAVLAANQALVATTAVGGDVPGQPHNPGLRQGLKLLLEIRDPAEPR
jgi:hypothetical protein